MFPISIIQETFFLGINLTAKYAGTSKSKVNSALDQACGGVLFIDEAYALTTCTYGTEVINTLVG